MFVELIDPETRLCAIDVTGLRSAKYDAKLNPLMVLILIILRAINYVVFQQLLIL